MTKVVLGFGLIQLNWTYLYRKQAMTTTMMMTIRATTSAATTPAMIALFSGSGCTSVGDDTGKEEMSGC